MRIFEDQARLLESQAFGNLSSKQKAWRPSFNTHIRFEKNASGVNFHFGEIPPTAECDRANISEWKLHQ